MSVLAFLFGYISGHLEDKKEEATLSDLYEAGGFLEEIEEAKNKIAEWQKAWQTWKRWTTRPSNIQDKFLKNAWIA